MKSTATTLLLAAALLAGAPSAGITADFFSLHVGGGHFALSVGAGDWGVYRDCWYDQRWAPDFNTTLTGYGEWVWVGGLGRVWKPWVAADWRPYTHGRWVYSDLGWTWVSFEPWGYLPHHYGEWAFTAHGWAWVPGYAYHPAKVVWVQDGSWLGWYPQAPRGWSHSHRAFHAGYDRGYSNGYWDGWNDARHATWVQWKNLGSENLAQHAVGSQSLRSHGARAPGAMANAPSHDDVRRHGARIEQTVMEQRRVTVAGRSMTMARPKGMAEVVERHAAPTVQRALSPDLQTRSARASAPQTGRSTSSLRSSAAVETRASANRTVHPAVPGNPRTTSFDRMEASDHRQGAGASHRAASSTPPSHRPASPTLTTVRGGTPAHRDTAAPRTSTEPKAKDRSGVGSSASRTSPTTRFTAASQRGTTIEEQHNASQIQVTRDTAQPEDRSRPTAADRRGSSANGQKRQLNQRRR